MFISVVFFNVSIYFIDNKVYRIYTINCCIAKIFDRHVFNMVNKNMSFCMTFHLSSFYLDLDFLDWSCHRKIILIQQYNNTTNDNKHTVTNGILWVRQSFFKHAKFLSKSEISVLFSISHLHANIGVRNRRFLHKQF